VKTPRPSDIRSRLQMWREMLMTSPGVVTATMTATNLKAFLDQRNTLSKLKSDFPDLKITKAEVAE